MTIKNQYRFLLSAFTACLLLLSSGSPARGEDTTGTIDTAPRLEDIAVPYEQLLLSPERMNGASRNLTPAQQKVADLIAAGENDIDKLVEVIITDHREVLDHIIINLAEQKLYEMNAEGEVLNWSYTSTGRSGYTTPTGNYQIVNKARKAYSKKYSAWMLHWMGFTPDGGYGIHGLEGSSYERRLGSVASHGCVRVSRAYARDVFERVKVGMPVRIVHDSSLELPDYEPLTRQAAMTMVLDVLSPADPWEIYY